MSGKLLVLSIIERHLQWNSWLGHSKILKDSSVLNPKSQSGWTLWVFSLIDVLFFYSVPELKELMIWTRRISNKSSQIITKITQQTESLHKDHRLAMTDRQRMKQHCIFTYLAQAGYHRPTHASYLLFFWHSEYATQSHYTLLVLLLDPQTIINEK